ncbi:MAG: DUF86 domain-containing protein [Methylococcaceae bacterium]|nr:DUF86 domain-containing protein [Methylococcaceae bacterium]
MSERAWRFYLNDMLGFAENVLTYSEDFTQEEFITTGLNYDATVRNLELIGEAATHIPTEIRETYNAIPWRQVIATRNRLIHGYLGIDNDTLWNIIQKDIPILITALEKITHG